MIGLLWIVEGMSRVASIASRAVASCGSDSETGLVYLFFNRPRSTERNETLTDGSTSIPVIVENLKMVKIVAVVD